MAKNDALIEKVTKIATTAALEYLERKEDEKKKRRLHNTKLLLRHYREFAHHVDGFALGAESEKYNVMVELDEEELAVESIKRSKERTFIIVQFIRKMLDIYRMICEQSNKPEVLRRYKIIMAMYVEEPVQPMKEIADCHKIENRTIYRDINEGCKALSALLFGIDGIRMYK